MSTEDHMGERDPRDSERPEEASRPRSDADRGDGLGHLEQRDPYRRRGQEQDYSDERRRRDRDPYRRDGTDVEHRSSIFSDLLRPFTELYESVSETLKRIGPLGPDVVERLGYRAVIAYFVENAPPVVGVVRGALLRQPHPKGWIVSQLFLAANGRPYMRDDERPYGRKLIVRRFDDELEELFGDRDMIIFD